MHVSQVKYYRVLPGHHCESASLSPALSLSLYSFRLSSPLPAKAGSKNSGELNSHNNMRLSGDRRNTVCAGQYRGSTSSEPGLLTVRKHCDKREWQWGFVCVLSPNPTLFVPLSLVFRLHSLSIFLCPIKCKCAIRPLNKDVLEERPGKLTAFKCQSLSDVLLLRL